MKKIISIFAVLCVFFGVANAQVESWFERDLTLSTDVRLGSNYAPIFGVKTSDNIALYSMIDVSHKSGFGVGFYRMDDFSSEMTGRIGFVDLYWVGNITNNLSVYAAAEYGWWDNWKEGRFFSPYSIVSYQLKSWNFSATPIYIYYDRLSEDRHQAMLKLEISKEIITGTSARVASWYDNLNPKKFHYALGMTQQLPANTYLSVDGILKPGGENFLAVGFGWKFVSK